MNYILVAINQVPEYLKFTVNSILSVDDSAKVFLLSDSKTKFKNITQLNIQDINSQKMMKFLSWTSIKILFSKTILYGRHHC